ncbi:uncharacterized protein LOC114576601 [Exaiptasia diaphana]|uniref:Uncharacterized protein n=1 Tax=Exaiptasia diaphana TaxID=2652724 RepID=A0A913YWE4_EXADI|nr:uncharacterized protein LOC114576601 [Exaiptasia diaphana]XP_028519387.1 uncharacterized protein LOC114576601 [Exaiptasia diaphana]
MLCGGHVGRSHGNNLKEHKGRKSVEKGFIDKHKTNHPSLSTAKCCCQGKKYSKGCGCISQGFLLAAKRNHFSALKQSGKSPEVYARRMKVLGKCHSRDVHQWTNSDRSLEECGFHPLVVCSCGKCGRKDVADNATENECEGNDDVDDSMSSDNDEHDDDCDDSDDYDSDDDDDDDSGDDDCEANDNDEDSTCSDLDDDPILNCSGKPFKTRNVLSCELHSLLYEIECFRVAQKAHDIVHDEMGRGHSSARK